MLIGILSGLHRWRSHLRWTLVELAALCAFLLVSLHRRTTTGHVLVDVLLWVADHTWLMKLDLDLARQMRLLTLVIFVHISVRH